MPGYISNPCSHENVTVLPCFVSLLLTEENSIGARNGQYITETKMSHAPNLISAVSHDIMIHGITLSQEVGLYMNL